MLMFAIGVGVVFFALLTAYSYGFWVGVQDTERRWSDAVGRGDDARSGRQQADRAAR